MAKKKTTKAERTSKLMAGIARAKKIQKANPKKKWTTCVKEAWK